MTKPISEMTPYELMASQGYETRPDITWDEAKNYLLRKIIKRALVRVVVGYGVNFAVIMLIRRYERKTTS